MTAITVGGYAPPDSHSRALVRIRERLVEVTPKVQVEIVWKIASRLRREGVDVIELNHDERDAFVEAVAPLRDEIDRSLPRELLSVST